MHPRLKLCFLQRIVLFEKQHFWVFVSWNIRNENKRVNKNHFLSCMSYLSLNKGHLSYPHYLFLQYLFVKHKIRFQTDDALFQNCVYSNANFVKKTKHFSIFEPLNIHNESKEVKKSHFIYYAPYIYMKRSNI